MEADKRRAELPEDDPWAKCQRLSEALATATNYALNAADEIARLRVALAAYADRGNWLVTYHPDYGTPEGCEWSPEAEALPRLAPWKIAAEALNRDGLQ
jgi:hypothetical protein